MDKKRVMRLRPLLLFLQGVVIGTGAILPLTPGLQEATLTFMGKAVNTEVARLAEVRHTDIRILLSLS